MTGRSRRGAARDASAVLLARRRVPVEPPVARPRGSRATTATRARCGQDSGRHDAAPAATTRRDQREQRRARRRGSRRGRRAGRRRARARSARRPRAPIDEQHERHGPGADRHEERVGGGRDPDRAGRQHQERRRARLRAGSPATERSASSTSRGGSSPRGRAISDRRRPGAAESGPLECRTAPAAIPADGCDVRRVGVDSVGEGRRGSRRGRADGATAASRSLVASERLVDRRRPSVSASATGQAAAAPTAAQQAAPTQPCGQQPDRPRRSRRRRPIAGDDPGPDLADPSCRRAAARRRRIRAPAVAQVGAPDDRDRDQRRPSGDAAIAPAGHRAGASALSEARVRWTQPPSRRGSRGLLTNFEIDVTRPVGGLVSVADVVDVILPVLDEAEALPWVLGAHAGRLSARSSSTTARRDGSAAIAARARRAWSSSSRGAASAPPAPPGSRAATSRRRLLHGLRRLARPARAAAVAEPVVDGDADLVLGARERRARGLAAARAARQPRARVASCAADAALALPDLGPMRAARREGLLDARDPRPPLRLAAGDGAARGARRVADRRGRRSLPPRGRALEGHRHGARNCARDGDMARACDEPSQRSGRCRADRDREGSLAGRCKTRLARRCTPAEAAAVAEAALADTLARSARDAGARAGGRARRRARTPGSPWLRGRPPARPAGSTRGSRRAFERRRRPGPADRHGHAAADLADARRGGDDVDGRRRRRGARRRASTAATGRLACASRSRARSRASR